MQVVIVFWDNRVLELVGWRWANFRFHVILKVARMVSCGFLWEFMVLS